MSSMPDRDGPSRPGSAGPAQAGQPGSQPGSQQDAGQTQQDAGQAQQDARESQQAVWGTEPGPRAAAVSQAETRVTWRRIFQYWIDAFFVSLIPYLVSIPFDRSSSTIMHIVGGVLYVVLFALIGLWYWVIWPHSHNGQTFAMKWFGLRVISKHGGAASMTQLFIRWISLLLDSAPWFWPFTGLLGLIVMLSSRYRQRIGDHLARTLVIRPAIRSYGGEGSTGGSSPYGAAQPEPGVGQEVGAGPHGRGETHLPALPGSPDSPGRQRSLAAWPEAAS